MAASLNFGLDKYDLNARLRPALLVALPALVLPAAWLPSVWTFMGGLSSLLVTCGVTLLLARIARHQGRRVEKRILKRDGCFPSVAALRHGDARIDSVTKARYHSNLRASGHSIPTAQQEYENSEGADNQYRSCVSWLLEQTRDRRRFDLLADDNLDYGFRRNLLGLRPLAIFLVVGCAIANAAAGYINWTGLNVTFWKATVVEFALLAALAAWLWIINERFVADASEAYAIRLLASCDHLRIQTLGNQYEDQAYGAKVPRRRAKGRGTPTSA